MSEPDDTPPIRARYGGLLDDHPVHEVHRLFLISLRRRYLYCPISKVANTSIKSCLFQAELLACGPTRYARPFDRYEVHDMLFGPLLYPYQLPTGQLRRVLSGPDFKRILFVRHPADRLVSCFLDRIQDPLSVPYRTIARALHASEPADISFDAFVSVIGEQSIVDMNPHWRPMYDEACCDSIAYDTVLRFEDMPHALGTLLEELYPPRVTAQIDIATNISPARTDASRRAAEFLTSDVTRKLAKIYAKDFEHFGY